MMNQTSNNGSLGDEEYTDFSCSTSIERLARDIETILRAWHVDRGSDRHVSIFSSTISSGSDPNQTDDSNEWDEDDPTSSLIRSNTIAWSITLPSAEGRKSLVVDLDLALWDAPESLDQQLRFRLTDVDEENDMDEDYDGEEGNNFRSDLTADSIDEEEASDLVRSLRRGPFAKMPSHDFLFDNFSSLFGIGQHISLTPIQPEPIPDVICDTIGASIVQRHDRSTTASWSLGATLCGWLQTALNIAASNCRCCIPVFGIWGLYRPNELWPTHPLLQTKNRRRRNRTGGTTATSGTMGSTTNEYSTGSPHLASQSHGHSHQSHSQSQSQSQSNARVLQNNGDDLLGRTIGASSAVSAKGVQIFPKWVQALRQARLPQPPARRNGFPFGLTPIRRNSASAGNGDGSHCNSHFVPPLVAGSVICPSTISMPMTSATFGCSILPDMSGNRIAADSRLAVWGSVLLQHCPETDHTVVLSGARHVFGWFKRRRRRGLLSFTTNMSSRRTSRFFSPSQDDSDYIQAIQEWRVQKHGLTSQEAQEHYEHSILTRRQRRDDNSLDGEGCDYFDDYRQECRDVALHLLQVSWGRTASSTTPLWGPLDDPVASLYATATWNGNSSEDGIVEPLLGFPLRIRSRRKLSQRDWIDMEESVERTILDPLSPSQFCVQVYYDRETSVSTLAANQRCVLAALIRSATLPGETLLQHLTDEALVELWDDNAGTIVANKLAERAKVGSSTGQIVNAMEWSGVIADMIELWEAEEIIHDVMDGSLTMDFPHSPDARFSPDDIYAPFRKSAPFGRLLSVLFAHMARLRSVSSMALVWGVFVQELRRRWESRESLPNMQYIPGLDPHPLILYERRCYSTIGLKANFAAFLHCSEPDPDDFHCLIGQKLQVFNLGVELLVAGEIAEHEAMERFLGSGAVPASAKHQADDLDGEKKRTLDSGVSFSSNVNGQLNGAVLAAPVGLIDPNQSKEEDKKWAREKLSQLTMAAEESKTNYGPPSIDTDLEFWVMDEPGHTANLDHGLDFVSRQTVNDGFDMAAGSSSNSHNGNLIFDAKLNESSQRSTRSNLSKRSKKDSTIVIDNLPDSQEWEGVVMDGSGGSVATSCSESQPYFDAAEAGSIFSIKHGFVNIDTVINVEELESRPGARCPVHGVNLASSGNQLYAPYLQRPFPLTDDVVLERRNMLSRDSERGTSKKGDLQYRIELSHRLQRPKLLSDMRAFKAANPSANFEDFTKWYGNPGNPLDDYQEMKMEGEYSAAKALDESAAKKLDKASEAMKVLNSTREFWSDCWQIALPIPASEQSPLFDVTGLVEMTLDYLEQMHPANLLNQVMAVNLSASYFTLVTSAGEALQIDVVRKSLSKLRTKIDDASTLLSKDTAGSAIGTYQGSKDPRGSNASSQRFCSDESITACEQACVALSEAETMIARAMSLLHKFSGQYELIQSLLCLADGSTIPFMDGQGRSYFLNLIHKQQKQHSTFVSWESLPVPVLREYVLRNLDEANPCQLSVRFGDEGAYLDRVDSEGGVLLALTKSYKD